jgi:Sensors of blue-light using FAD
MTGAILQTAQAHNEASGISGVLCQGQGLFLQVLEGERRLVNELYARIVQDQRHTNVELLEFQEITKRRFGRWSMAHVYLSKLDPMVKLNHPEFDPYTASGPVVMRLLEDLISNDQLISLLS